MRSRFEDGQTEAATARDDAALSIVKQRAKPRLLILDDALTVAFADPHALQLLWRGEPHRAGELPPAVLRALHAGSAAGPGAAAERVLAPLPGIVLRISRLEGAAGSCTAVFVEEQVVREDLLTAASRYRLTRRELEVLTLVMSGLSGADMGERLCISELTAVQYCKNLLRKTQSKNRSEMLAKILGWDRTATDRSSEPPRP